RSAVSSAAARAPRAATLPPRRRAWPRIFVVRCSLLCDPPVEGHDHAMEALYYALIARSVTTSRPEHGRPYRPYFPKSRPHPNILRGEASCHLHCFRIGGLL